MHGDLKEDNKVQLLKPIIVEKEEIHLSLIDFSFSHRFLDDNKNYIKQNYKFYENFYYSSYNSLSNWLIPRKDDLYSICYIILNISGVKFPMDKIQIRKGGKEEQLKYKENMEKYKKNINYDFIGNELNCIKIILEEIDKLNFDDAPNYYK